MTDKPSFIQYGDTFNKLIADADLCPLGPGRQNMKAKEELNSLSIATAFDCAIEDQEMALCCLSGVWLLHNFLDESHTISQDIGSSEGSFWHGIMHRREPDYSNAKYWFRKVGDHPVLGELAATQEGGFDPFDFVDRCQQASIAAGRGDNSEDEACRELQTLEWKLLFDHCYRLAVG